MYPNPYACYVAKASEVNGLVSSNLGYGATASNPRSNSEYYTRELKKGEKRKRSGLVFILFCITALITVIVFVADRQPEHIGNKPISVEVTSTRLLEQSTEPPPHDSESSTKSEAHEIDVQTEEFKKDQAEQKYIDDAMTAESKSAAILKRVSDDANSVVKSAEQMAVEWTEYEELQNKANESLSKFKELAASIVSSGAKYRVPSLSTLQKAIQPTVSWGTNWTNFLPAGVKNTNISSESKINCGSPGDRSIWCCMEVLCGAFLAKGILSEVTESNITAGLKCMKYGNGNFTNCFNDIPATNRLMTCMACNSCITKPVDLNCSKSDSIDFSKFFLE